MGPAAAGATSDCCCSRGWCVRKLKLDRSSATQILGRSSVWEIPAVVRDTGDGNSGTRGWT